MPTGTVNIDFGAAPGTNYIETVVSGQTGIAAGSHVEAFMMGDATAGATGHNAYEHTIAPIMLRCGGIVAGTSFVIYANCGELRLNGIFTVHWVWV